MLKTATLFSILAVLAHAQEAARGWKQGYAPEDNTPCYVNGQQGSVKGALCVIVSDLLIELTCRVALASASVF